MFPAWILSGMEAKDDASQKDVWRKYAIDTSAAFASALMRSPELAAGNPIPRYEWAVIRTKRELARHSPKSKFRYRVAFVDSPAQLRDELHEPNRPINDLIPSDLRPAIALHGLGGAGKSRILQVLFSRIHDLGRKPILLNLKQYSLLGEEHPDTIVGAALKPLSVVDAILRVSSAPTVSRSDLHQLARRAGDVVVLVDGLNEIARDARLFLLDFLRSLLRTSRVRLLVTDRFGPSDDLAAFQRARVEPLELEFVRRTLQGRFSASRYKALSSATLRL